MRRQPVHFNRSGVKYPLMVAEGDSEDAMKFNCTQRSHQNTLEQVPTFLAMQLLLAQVYPVTAAALGMAWNAGMLHCCVAIFPVETSVNDGGLEQSISMV